MNGTTKHPLDCDTCGKRTGEYVGAVSGTDLQKIACRNGCGRTWEAPMAVEDTAALKRTNGPETDHQAGHD